MVLRRVIRTGTIGRLANLPGRRIAAAASLLAISPILLTSCIFPSPNPSTNAKLWSVAALTRNNAWAVGTWADGHGAHDLIEHWDGHTWRIISAPSPGGTGLVSITAITPSNLWAVGSGRSLHFDGHFWRPIPVPAGLIMTDVASSPTGVVRAVALDAQGAPRVLFPTASGWQTMASSPTITIPGACDPDLFYNLAVLSPSDIWAVGSTYSRGGCAYTSHWNGTSWTQVATPSIPNNVTLNSVSARGTHDVWAAGTSSQEDAQSGWTLERSIALHWDGVSWKQIATGDQNGSHLNSISATPQGVWAVGGEIIQGGLENRLVIKRFNGTSFVNQPVQQLVDTSDSRPDLDLNGVTVNDGVVTSVGNYLPRPGVRDATLIDRRNAS
jgi:hypothetical protein